MQVWPKNDAMRKILKHPGVNVPFRDEGPSNWPEDSFTHRRLADGDIVTSDPNPPKVKVEPEAVGVDPESEFGKKPAKSTK